MLNGLKNKIGWAAIFMAATFCVATCQGAETIVLPGQKNPIQKEILLLNDKVEDNDTLKTPSGDSHWIKSISRNKPLIIGGTTLALIAFMAGRYMLANHFPTDELHNFMGQTSVLWEGGNYFSDCAGSLSYYTDNTPTRWGIPIAGSSYGLIPGEAPIPGNMTDWANYIHSQCPSCGPEDLLNLMTSTPTDSGYGHLACKPNWDNTSLCCTNFQSSITSRVHACSFGDYCLRVLTGDGLAAEKATIVTYMLMSKLYDILGGSFALSFVWIWMIAQCI